MKKNQEGAKKKIVNLEFQKRLASSEGQKLQKEILK